jgi:hypothetical protein
MLGSELPLQLIRHVEAFLGSIVLAKGPNRAVRPIRVSVLQ